MRHVVRTSKWLLVLFLLAGFTVLNAQELISFEGNETSTELTIPDRLVEDNQPGIIQVSYEFDNAGKATIEEQGMTWHTLSVGGFAHLEEIGKPNLPSRIDHLLLPDNVTPSVTVVEAEYTEMDGYMIYPALEPAVDTYGAPNPEFYADESIYQNDAFFPEAVVAIKDIQVYKGARLGLVQTIPVQFNPVTGKIRVYSRIVYEIVFPPSAAYSCAMNTEAVNSELRGFVANAQSVPKGIDPSEVKSDAKDYIIITHSAFIDAANDLAEWKQQLGYTVEVVSQSSWTSAQVKDAIQTRYANWTPKPSYFVIFGDHSGTYPVPGELLKNPSNETYASDHYYACMDGTYDYYADMAFGRISVTSADQANTVVQKIINYEKNPVADASFYQNGLNCAYFQDDNGDGWAERRFTHTSEDIRNYTMAQGYTVQRIYDTESSTYPTNYNNGYYSNGEPLPAELLKPGFAWDGGASDITNAINSGKFYVFHRDHGYTGGVGWASPYFVTSSINTLTNGNKLPVLFSINCHTGEFYQTECFAEKFLRHDAGGAVGVIAAAQYSYSGYNDGFSLGAIDAIWSDPGLIPNFGSGGVSNPNLTPHGDIVTMGDVLNQALIRMVETWGFNQYTFELYHYFGDPAMKIWTAQPQAITATVPANCDPTSIQITGSTCADGLATAMANGVLIGETLLSGGNGTITFPNQADNTVITVTISQRNYEPYIAQSTVVSGPAVTPVADFSGTPVTIFEGETVNFSDLSQNSPTSWSWTFTGGTPATSTDQNPSVVYAAAGTYTVALTATNEAGSDTKTVTDYITVNVVPPTADFTADNTYILFGESVQFSDLSANNPTSWSWTFAGGTPANSTLQNPSVLYDTPGVYDVSLTVANAGGTDVETKSGYITVSDGSVTYCDSRSQSYDTEYIRNIVFNTFSFASGGSYYSDFTAQEISLEAGEICSITLTPQINKRNRREFWRIWIDLNVDGDFNDAGELVFSADGQKSEVTGTFSVPNTDVTTTMRISMKYASAPTSCEIFANGEVEDYTVIIGAPVPEPPTADFSADQTAIFEGETVSFTDQSLNNPTAWSWTFNGGTPATSTAQNPSVTYAVAGTYTVALTVTNEEGSDTKTVTDYITVTVPPAPVADFTADNTLISIGGSVQFTDMSENGPTGWNWTFPGGTPSTSTQQNPVVTYDAVGVYDVSLTVNNAQGSDSKTITGYITVEDNPVTDYCATQGLNYSIEWIAGVSVDGFTNTSGAGGYSDFTNQTINLSPGATSSISVVPGFSGRDRREAIAVWIDYNADGDFADANETVFTIVGAKSTVSGSFYVPAGLTGFSRMRVSLNYKNLPPYCGDFENGEAEDYTVAFGAEGLTLPQQLSVYPNPTSNNISVAVPQKGVEGIISVFSLTGELIYQAETDGYDVVISSEEWSNGIYIMQYSNIFNTYITRIIKQ
jgi:PKD repeat protein